MFNSIYYHHVSCIMYHVIVIFIFYQRISLLSGDVLLLLYLSFIGEFPCYQGMFFYCYLYLLSKNFFVIRGCPFIVIFIFYQGFSLLSRGVLNCYLFLLSGIFFVISGDVLVALCDQPLPSGNNARCQPELTGQSVLTNIQYGEHISNILRYGYIQYIEIWIYMDTWIYGHIQPCWWSFQVVKK